MDRFNGVLPLVQELFIQIVLAIIIVLVGVLIASLVRKLIASIINAFNINRLLQPTGFIDMVERAGYTFNAGAVFGFIAKWTILIVFFAWALEIVGMESVNAILIHIVVVYVPRIIIAAVVLFLGLVLADLIKKIVAGSVRATGMGNVGLVAVTAKTAIVVFTILLVFEIIGVGAEIVNLLFTGFIGMLMIAGGVAFGLGGKDAAADILRGIRRGVGHE